MEKALQEIKRLKERKKAVILAHNYQLGEIQQLADFVGDSYALSRKAVDLQAQVIIFCGVYFMAESAALLSPEREVLIPVKEAGCPLADSMTAEDLQEMKKQHPGVPVVAYVNTTAQVKAESDICCTSSNALQVVNQIPGDRVIFVPDRNLAHYVDKRTHKEIIPGPGCCMTHHRLSRADVERVRTHHPQALIFVHPESPPAVVEEADFVGGTGAILEEVKGSKAQTFFIGTEVGILHRMQKENPGKTFSLLSPDLICPDMKKTTIQDVLLSLQEHRYPITIPDEIRERAVSALNQMLTLG